MKGRHLVFLSFIALGVILTAVQSFRKGEQAVRAPEAFGRHVLPDLPVNDLDRIVIRNSQDTITLLRGGEYWGCKERYDYPLNFEQLKQAVSKLADLKVGQIVSLNDKQKRNLKLVQPAGPTAGTNAPAVMPDEGTVVELYRGNTRAAQLLIGDIRKSQVDGSPSGGFPEGQYLSTNGGQTVYLVSAVLSEFTPTANRWLDADLFSVPPSDLKRVTVSGTNGQTMVELTRKEPGESLTVTGITDREEPDAAKVSGLENAFSYLRMDDVAAPGMSDETLGFTSPSTVKAFTQDRIYTIRFGGTTPDGRHYARLEVALLPFENAPVVEVPPVSTNAADAAEAAAQAKEKADARAAAGESVKALNAKLGAWTYVLAAHKVASLRVDRDALVNKKGETPPEAVDPDDASSGDNTTSGADAGKPSKKRWYNYLGVGGGKDNK